MSGPPVATPAPRLRTALICHEASPLTRRGLSRWLASFSDLVAIVSLRERPGDLRKRARREIRRIGWLRFADVVAFRIYSRLFLADSDASWERAALERLEASYPPVPADTPVLLTDSPNTPEVARFLEARAPDLAVARCKVLLRERIFSIPRLGTFVFHPGICPRYRNSHGGFWALANDDLQHVGMTLLRIDAGVDTGPVFAYHRVDYDETRESHTVIQHRMVLDNLDSIRRDLEAIGAGTARPIDTSGEPSAVWGQPWLTRYLRWKRQARRRAR